MNDRDAAALFHVATSAPTPDERVAACDQLVRWGRFEVAEPALADLADDSAASVAVVARRLLAVSRQLRRWGIARRLERPFPAPEDADGTPDFSGDAGVLLARRAGAASTVCVFTGTARMVWLSLHVLHQVLPQDCHVVYLRDARGLCYLKGVEELGASYDETLQGLRRLLESLGGRRLYCIGSSGGGYAALRYGLDLGARAVLAFAPSTDGSNLARFFEGTVLEGLHQSAPHVAVDLRALYAAASDPPQVTAVFGEKEERDAAASLRLAGLPTVTLHPVPGYDRHDVIAQTIGSGEFRVLLDRMLAVP